MTSTLDTLNTLIKARELLSEEGAWTDGELLEYKDDGTKCMCALGAVGVAAGFESEMELGKYDVFDDRSERVDPTAYAAVLALLKPLDARYTKRYTSVFMYNDRFDDAGPVLEWFDKVIEDVRNQLALETLTEAKRLIIEKGWGKTELIADNGCMCALGGIASAATGISTKQELLALTKGTYGIFSRDNEFSDEAAIVAAEAFRSVLTWEEVPYPDHSFTDVYRFNDTQPSEGAVLVVFDRAIANLTKEN
ncbi:hypothetical protein SEA_ANON_73 [Gordonia phage Anon]|nr:hypothetical protein SEA_ANON_73 [Gordonia phage Anon]